MSTLSLRIPESLHKRVKELSKKDKISINQFVTSALAEKISALETLNYLAERANRGKRDKYLKVLSKVPDVEPEEYDKISGAPKRVLRLDQGRRGISSPGNALDILRPLMKLYADSEDAHALGLGLEEFKRPCTVCEGAGRIRTELGFYSSCFN